MTRGLRLANKVLLCAELIRQISLSFVAVTCALLLSPAAAQDLPTDPFRRLEILSGAAANDIHRRALDLTLGRRGAERRIVRWLNAHRDAPAEERVVGWLALCSERFRRQHYADALAACERGEELRSGAASGIIPLLRAARDVAPILWSQSGVDLALDDRQVAVSNGEASVLALVDKGAEIAIVMESVAQQLGGRALTGDVGLETTTTPIAGGLVVFDRLTIGGAELRNLVALVLPDEQLELGEGDTLRLVLSLPVLTAMSRAAFLDHGARLALGEVAPRVRGRSTPLYWDSSGLGFGADFANGRRGVHFDTGSRRTWLFPAAMSAVSAAELATRQPFTRTIGGLGGERVERASKLANVTLGVAGWTWRLQDIEVAEGDENGEAARVGFNLLDHFEAVALDFRTMRMSVVE